MASAAHQLTPEEASAMDGFHNLAQTTSRGGSSGMGATKRGGAPTISLPISNFLPGAGATARFPPSPHHPPSTPTHTHAGRPL